MDKTCGCSKDAISKINDGATVMIGGFGGAGAPIELIHALIRKGARDLTIINNNAGNGRVGIAAMIDAGMVRKMICSFPRSSDPRAFTEKYLAGDIELELVPQGTLAERIRAGGAGIPAFYTPTAYGTDLAQGKPVAEFEGRPYIQERWLKADFALIKAETGDAYGNLTYNKAARNFSSLMCMAAQNTIVQVSHLVPVGAIDPEPLLLRAYSSIPLSKLPTRNRKKRLSEPERFTNDSQYVRGYQTFQCANRLARRTGYCRWRLC